MNEADARIGEVVEADSITLTVQCYRLYGSPPLGAIVRAGDAAVYAVVTEVRTEGLDPSRPVTARGEAEATEEDVYLNNPQLAQLLTTRFKTVVIGYQSDTGVAVGLPPLPPKVHSFVGPCPADTVEELTWSGAFLRLLLDAAAPDEVIAACVRLAGGMVGDGQGLRVRSAKTLALELVGQVPRLNAMMRRLA